MLLCSSERSGSGFEFLVFLFAASPNIGPAVYLTAGQHKPTYYGLFDSLHFCLHRVQLDVVDASTRGAESGSHICAGNISHFSRYQGIQLAAFLTHLICPYINVVPEVSCLLRSGKGFREERIVCHTSRPLKESVRGDGIFSSDKPTKVFKYITVDFRGQE